MEDPKIVVSARLSLRDLAVAARFLKSEGIIPSSRTDVVRHCLEAITGAVEGNKVDPITSTEEALKVFESVGIELQRSEKNKKSIEDALDAEELSTGDNDPEQIKQIIRDTAEEENTTDSLPNLD